MTNSTLLPAIIACFALAGCATSLPQPQPNKSVALSGSAETTWTEKDQIDALNRRIESLTASLAVCEAELAKDGKYVVQWGDTLNLIAKRNGIEVRELVQMNAEILTGPSSNWKPGIVLRIRKREPTKSDATPQ